MSRLSDEHNALCHPDGSECPDGCDRGPMRRQRAHTAKITCGRCGHGATIALGLASAIACAGCGITIVLGEQVSQ